MRILNAESNGYSPEARNVLAGLGDLCEAQLDRLALMRELPSAEVLIVRLAHQIDREMLGYGGRLKAIVSATTGLDHIDLEACKERGIEVISLKGETEFLRDVPATAELTWALLLALTRRIIPAHRAANTGLWDRDDFKGTDLKGKVMGIVGYGRIGKMVAAVAQAFGMHAMNTNPGYQDSDVVTVHLPLNEETRGMFREESFASMKRGALFINTSRGEIVDEAALLDALRSGHLGGAALDTICDERINGWKVGPLQEYAQTHDNLILTPHIGGCTVESMAKTELFVARKLKAFLKVTA